MRGFRVEVFRGLCLRVWGLKARSFFLSRSGELRVRDCGLRGKNHWLRVQG